jgi:cholest-4-en-3-one 26-monooxygenase
MTHTLDTTNVDPHDVEIDVVSHEQWAHGVPHDKFAWLREHAPVARLQGTEDDMPEHFWALTLHEDVVEAGRDWETFSSQRGSVHLVDHQNAAELTEYRTIIDTDPPAHTRLRRVVNRGFTPRAVGAIEGHYRIVAGEIIDAALEAGGVDFVTAIAAELPLVAIAELLGVPVEDRHKIFEWTNRMVGRTDPEYDMGPDAPTEAAAELYAYANMLAADRRKEPRGDIVTTLITEVDGDALAEHEFELFVLALSVAGSETTRNAISHGLHALLEHPDEMARLRGDVSGRIDTAVDEMVRWATPVIRFRRTTQHPIEVRGVTIPEGEAVVLFYTSANRDDAAFDDPMRFDITRDPNPQVGFGGGGPHFCLGANLARLEIKVMFEELLARTAAIELAGEPQRLRSSFINGLKHLPVTLTRA